MTRRRRQTPPHSAALRLNLNSRDTDAHHALEIISWWKKQRAAAGNVVKAIRMFYALTQGDTSLLIQYFPQIVIALMSTSNGGGLRPTYPAQANGTIASEPIVKTPDELADDMFSF